MGSEANERFDHWVEQCRQQLERGAASNALATWMLSEGVGSETAAAILRAAQNRPAADVGSPAPAAAATPGGATTAANGTEAEPSAGRGEATQPPGTEATAVPQPGAPTEATTAVAPPEPPVTPESAATVFARAFGRSRQETGSVAHQAPPRPTPPLATAAAIAVQEPDAAGFGSSRQTDIPKAAPLIMPAGQAEPNPEPAPPAATAVPNGQPPPRYEGTAEAAPALSAIGGEPVASAPPPSSGARPAESVAAQNPAAFQEPSAPVPPPEPVAVPAMQPAMAAAPIPPSNLFGTPRPPSEAPVPVGFADELSEPEAPEAAGPEPFDGPDDTLQELPSLEMPPGDVAAADSRPEPNIRDDGDAADWKREDAISAAMEEPDTGETDSFPPEEFGTGLNDAESSIALVDEDLPEPDGEESDSHAEPGADVDDPDPPSAFSEEALLAADDAESDPPGEHGDERSVPPDEPQENTPADQRDPADERPGASVQAEEEAFEYPDSLEDAAARMGMSLSDPLRETPEESYEEFLAREQNRNSGPEDERDGAPPRSGGKRIIDLRDGAGTARAEPAGEGELARAIREAGESMPGAGSEAAEGELARAVREAEGRGRDGVAPRIGPADDEEEPAQDVREPEADGAGESGPPSGDSGPATEEDLARAARELGISFRDDPDALLQADPEMARAARELGIDFRGDSEDGGVAAPDDEMARAARELGISFREDEAGTRGRKKRKSSLARYWPIFLLVALAATAMPVLGIFMIYWTD